MRIQGLALIFAAAAAAWAQNAPALPAAGNVSLPLDEYNRLKELAAKPAKPPEGAPIAFALQSAAYQLRVTERAVTGKIDLEGEVLHTGPVKARLVSGVTVLDAHRGNDPLPLTQENGVHSAVLTGPGPFSIALDAGLPLLTEPGRASFTLTAPAAGAVRLHLTVPGEQTVVTLSPGLILARAPRAGNTEIEATLSPGAVTRVSWAMRLTAPPPAAPKEMKFLSDVKTLVSVNEGEIAMAALADLTVTQGEASQFEMRIPAGYEVTGASGPSLQRSEARNGAIVLYVNGANVRSHQFLVSLSKIENGAKLDLPLPGFNNALRETGEALVEGSGTIEIEASARGGIRRGDVKEASLPLRSLAAQPVYAAFRYQKKPGEDPGLALSWTRFPDAAELAAIAQQATVTTLVTIEGRSLTEVKLSVKNQSQPFVKVDLPSGASILSADVAGEKVKPVQGADGSRIPLLRAGFRPTGPYTVSFVFLNSGAPFAKKGSGELDLPKMDIPIGVTRWEVFLPRQFAVSDFAGDATAAELMPASPDLEAFAELRDPDEVRRFVPAGGGGGAGNGVPAGIPGGAVGGVLGGILGGVSSAAPSGDVLTAGQIGGYVLDAAGARVSGASVTATSQVTGATRVTVTGPGGHWLIGGLPPGPVRVSISAPGFQRYESTAEVKSLSAAAVDARLQIGSAASTVIVSSPANNSSALVMSGAESRALEQQKARQNEAASQNVLDLEKRVAGVLPISINIPRAGNSYQFIRPLVVGEVTRLTFNYRATK